MTCQRANDIDLAGLSADPRAAEWEDFRDHYPGCADCSRAVAAWSRLEAALGAAGDGSAHPAEAELLAFETEPGGLAPARRTTIERHVSGCDRCSSELSVLRSFDFDAVAAPAAAAASPVPARPGLGARLAALAELIFAGMPQPMLVAAVLVLLAVPVFLLLRGGPDAPPERGTIEIVEEPPPRAPELPDAPLTPVDPPAIAGTDEPAVPESRLPEPPTPPPQLAQEPPATLPSEPPAQPAPAPRAIVQAPRPDAPKPDPTAPADLLALLPEEPPRYAPQLVLAGGSLDRVTLPTAVRSSADALPSIHALSTGHVAATASPTPTLYWFLAARADVPVELALIDPEGIEPLLSLRVSEPVEAGLHAVDTAAAGVRLVAGRTYHWSASLVPDANRRSADVVSEAAVRLTRASPELARRLDEGGPAQRVHVLAAAGYWIDAFEAATALVATHPADPRPRAIRDALLEQAGLADVAAALDDAAR